MRPTPNSTSHARHLLQSILPWNWMERKKWVWRHENAWRIIFLRGTGNIAFIKQLMFLDFDDNEEEEQRRRWWLKHCWSIVEAACQFKSRQFFELKVVLRLLPDAWGPYPARYLVPLLVIPGQKAVALAVLPMRFPALWGVMVKSSGCKTGQGFSLWAASDHGNLPETCSTPRGTKIAMTGIQVSRFTRRAAGSHALWHWASLLHAFRPGVSMTETYHVWYTLYLSMCTKCSRGQCQQTVG